MKHSLLYDRFADYEFLISMMLDSLVDSYDNVRLDIALEYEEADC